MRYSLEEIQSLEAKIDALDSAEEMIDALNDLAWRLRNRQKEQTFRLSEKACALSQSGRFAAQPYRKGLAACLTTQAAINVSRGKLDTALDQCIQALSLLDGLPSTHIIADAWNTICWVHIYYGDYPTAFNYALKALQLARELGARDREARALDAVGSTFGVSAEYKNSIENHEEALRIFRELEDPEGEALCLNNLACSLVEMGNYADAFPISLQSLELTQQHQLLDNELVFSSTIADVLVQMHEFEKAGKYLQQALAKASAGQNEILQVVLLSGLAKLYRAQRNFEAEEPCLIQALAIANKNDYKSDQMICHQLLSEVYENRGQPFKALEHYKQFFTLKETTSGAETARQIAALKATYQLEISRREAEIYRAQNMELQHEIEERKRVEGILEKLAIYDPLTNLFNRRQFGLLTTQELERSARYGHPFSLLMLDLDHFKWVNDSHGHLIGDRVLITIAATIQSQLRASDIVGRYGGEEFVIMLPETSSSRAFEVAERVRVAVSEASFNALSGPISVTVSIGITQHPGGLREQPMALDELLHRADQALYAAKRAGRNRTQCFEEISGGASRPASYQPE